MSKYVAIVLGGSLGALARYGVGAWVVGRLGTTKFWYGTFIINMMACGIIGFSLTYMDRKGDMNPFWRFLIPVGFVGAYSTFSTFEWELFTGLQSSSYLLSAIYVVSSIIFGLGAIWAGVALGRILP